VLIDGEHVFKGERLEIEAVAGVVVGGDRLRVAVDHDGLVAVFAQRESRVAAAVIELNALADAVRAAAEDDDFALRGGRRFVFFVVAGVEVRSEAFEFRGAGVHELVDGTDFVGLAELADLRDAFGARKRPEIGEALVRKAETLGFA
jgi:hypothetical protein